MKKILPLLFVCIFNYANATNYYFSSISGDDTRSTSQASNPLTPWKTLSKLNSFIANLKYGDSVLFKRGENFNGFIAVNISGSSNLPIVFSAYGSGSKPVINGFTALSTWKLLGNNIYECYNASLGTVVNMVTVNGVQQAMGRYPNTTINKGYLTFESHGTNSITDNQLTSTTNWTGAEVVVKSKRWILDRCIITSQVGSTINYSPALTYNPYDNYGYFFQNDIRTLDLPNEWYYNSSTKKMNVYSLPSKFNASTVDVLVTIRNQSNIIFDNLMFTGSNSKTFDLVSSQNIQVKNCDITFSGTDGICGSSTTNLVLVNNTITNTNNNALNLNYNCNNTIIRNNVIKNTGIYAGLGKSGDNTYMAVTIKGNNNLVEYNEIDSTGYTAINFNGGDSTIIKNNFINYFTMTKDDGGGIYTFNGGSSPGKFYGRKIMGNIILNGIGLSEGTDKPGSSSSSGIYMDDNVSGVEILSNTVANCGKTGIFFHNAYNITTSQNTIFNNSTQLIMVHDISTASAPLRNEIMKNNIFFSKTSTQMSSSISSINSDVSLLGNIDSNYYCRPLDDNLVIYTSQVNTAGSRVDEILDLKGWQTKYNFDKFSKKSPVQIAPYTSVAVGPNLLPNGYFNSNISGLYTSSTSSWTSNKLDVRTLQATNTSSTTSNYQIIMASGAIDPAKNYLLRFSAQSLKDTILKIYLRTSGSPYTKLSDTKIVKITTARTENEFLFSLPAGATSASLIFETRCPKLTFWLDNVELYEAKANITNPDDSIRFEYNATQLSKTFSLPGTYIDVNKKAYTNTIMLAPYTSAVLIKQNSALSISALPLTFMDFSGVIKNKNIELNWQTTNEINTDYFEVERSYSGSAYTHIGTVVAQNNPGVCSYIFNDNSSLGAINYYRIKQFDKDGKFIYSKIIHFKNADASINISPNPAKNKVTLTVNDSQQNQTLNIFIYSASGALIKAINGNSSNSSLSIDVSNFIPGVYYVKGICGTKNILADFVKL